MLVQTSQVNIFLAFSTSFQNSFQIFKISSRDLFEIFFQNFLNSVISGIFNQYFPKSDLNKFIGVNNLLNKGSSEFIYNFQESIFLNILSNSS